MKLISEQQGNDRHGINLLILLAVALCVGVYLIVTTTLIASDGVTFIKYARGLEIDPVKTMRSEYQHPGFPGLILAAHKVWSCLGQGASISSWIYCSQGIALIFRLLAVTLLYFIGVHLFGSRMSFWGTLILIILPKPAEYGSDALSDWPHLFFLTAGLLLLFKGAASQRGWLFGLAGLSAGAGYLIRPECSQLVILGGLWLGLKLLGSKHSMGKGKAMSTLVLFVLGFLVVAVPYMNLKGALFPKKNVGQFVESLQPQDSHDNLVVPGIRSSPFLPSTIAKAFGKLALNMCETLMWFFVPALFIGMVRWFRTRAWHEPDIFFIVVLIALNIPILIWLYCNYGYMSDRHTLPLLIIPILFVPVGLQEMSIWLQQKLSGQVEPLTATGHKRQFWFLVLVVTGVLICVPKLLTPIRSEKQGYRGAAQWLKIHTDRGAIAAVPDKRISFYAERAEFVYEGGGFPEKAEYIVKIVKKQKDPLTSIKPSGKIEYEYIDKTRRGMNVVVYRNR